MPRDGNNWRRGLVALAIAVAVLSWLLWPTVDAAPPTATAPIVESPEPRAAVADVVAAPPLRTDLSEVAPEPARPADLEQQFPFTLQVDLLDAFGLPVPDGLVFAGPPLCGLSLWPQPTDERGEVRLQWQGRVRSMPVQIAVMAWGVLQPLRRITVETERTRRLSIVVRGRQQTPEVLEQLRQRRPEQAFVDAGRVRRGRLRRTDDLDMLCGRTMLLFREFECVACHEPSRIAAYSTLARSGTMQLGLHPTARFQDLRSGALQPSQRDERERMLQQSGNAADARPRHFDAHAGVTGMVRRPDGTPAANVPVAWLDKDGALRQRTTTNVEGRYRLAPVAAGLLDLVAGGGDSGVARTALVTIDHLDTGWDCRLERSSVVRGIARDDTGAVLVDWRVEFERSEDDWAGLATTQNDGTFTLTAVPGTGQCLLWPADADLKLPVQYGRIAIVDGPPLQFDLGEQQPSRSRLRVHVQTPGDCDWAQVELRVCQLDTGRVAQLTRVGHEEAFELGGLTAGGYQVEAGAAVLGWVDFGVFQLDGRGLWDVGTVHLLAPGRVRLRLAGGAPSPLAGEHAFYRRTDTVDVQESYRRAPGGELLLAAGEHVLIWRDKTGRHSASFHVDSGSDCELLIAAQ